MTRLDLEFRFASASDVEAIVALVESAYRGELSHQGWTTEANLLEGQRTDPDEVTQIIRDTQYRMLLAHSRDELIACAVVKNEGGTAYLGMITVRPSRQGSGLGRQLLAEAEKCAFQEFGATHARMTVIVQREELIQWYERRGYVRTQDREPWPYGNPRFGLPLRPDLEFLVMTKPLDA